MIVNGKEVKGVIDDNLQALEPESAELERRDVYLALQSSDADIARVTEDLIYLLIQKNIILFTELPEVVQTKLLSREQLRGELGQQVISPLSDQETL